MALCSASSNPLAQFSKHLQEDRGLQRDRLVPNDAGLRQQSFRTSRHQQGQAIEEFALFDAPLSSPVLPNYSTRHRNLDIDFVSLPRSKSSHSPGQAWGSEFSNFEFGISRVAVSSPHLYRAREGHIQGLQKQPRKPKTLSTHQTNPKYHIPRDSKYGSLSTTRPWRLRSDFGLATDFDTRSSVSAEQPRLATISLEKTMEDFDWEALFASLDAVTQAMDTHAGDQSSILPENWTNLEAAIGDPAPGVTEPIGDQMLHIAPAAESTFSPIHEAFERGMQIVHNDENLSLAVHAFQEAARADSAHFEAWKMLGSVLAEVEREAEAILAFDEALRLEPNNLDVLMRLAVSHTNEGSHDSACECLERWIKIKYPQILIPKLDSQAALASRSDLFERIKDPFIQAARLSLEEENIDPDVQIGLGVLMFSAGLYDMAADCFYAAIQSTETGSTEHQTQLHLLWNRYAACLGNVRDKEHIAVEAYETALALKPNFVKARCNLGVLYHNINEPLKGARCTLDAIISSRTIHSTSKDGTKDAGRSSSCSEITDEPINYNELTEMYEMLMKCCSSMCRWDLAELVGLDMDLKGFKAKLDCC